MKYYLVKFEKNWRDEFDYIEYTLMTENEKNNMYKMLLSYENYVSDVYFGTNQGWEDLSSEDILNSLSCEDISKEYYDKSELIYKGIPTIVEDFLYYEED